MSKLNKLPYAKWLEESLQNLINADSKSICILSKNDNGEIGSGYWNCSVGDKILFAGFVQQDAMIETLVFNGYIEDEEESDETVGDFEEDDDEEGYYD